MAPHPSDPLSHERSVAGELIREAFEAENHFMRLKPIDYAADVDRQRGLDHIFGREITGRVADLSLDTYFEDKDMPAIDEVRTYRAIRNIHQPDYLRVLRSVMKAVGVTEEGEGINIQPVERAHTDGIAPLIALVEFDFSYPMVEYALATSEVIAWNPRNRLRV